MPRKYLRQELEIRARKKESMESTGKYWLPVYNVLENDSTIALAHPK